MDQYAYVIVTIYIESAIQSRSSNSSICCRGIVASLEQNGKPQTLEPPERCVTAGMVVHQFAYLIHDYGTEQLLAGFTRCDGHWGGPAEDFGNNEDLGGGGIDCCDNSKRKSNKRKIETSEKCPMKTNMCCTKRFRITPPTDINEAFTAGAIKFGSVTRNVTSVFDPGLCFTASSYNHFLSNYI